MSSAGFYLLEINRPFTGRCYDYGRIIELFCHLLSSLCMEKFGKLVIAENAAALLEERFNSSLDHTLAELKRIELMLSAQVKILRQHSAPDNDANFRGLYISDKEIDDILIQGNSPAETILYQSEPALPGAFTDLAARLEQIIAERKQDALDRGTDLRLDRLKNLFGLSQFEVDTLLICLLPEIALKYQRLLAYLQDDVTKKSPTIDLVLQVLCDSAHSRIKSREFLSNDSPLIKYQLIHLEDDPVSRMSPWLTRSIRLDDRITSFLLESDRIDARLSELAIIIRPQGKLKDSAFPDSLKEQIGKLIAQFKNSGPVYYLYGTDEAGKQTLAEAICADLNIPLLYIEMNNLLADMAPETAASLIFREGCLQNAAIYINGFNTLADDGKGSKLLSKSLINGLNHYPRWVFVSSDREGLLKGIVGNKPCFNMEISTVAYPERRRIWESAFQDKAALAPDVDLADIAGKFKFTRGQIAEAVNLACNLARWRDPDQEMVTGEDLYTACRKLSRETLSKLARKIQPTYHWQDIVLPRDQMDQLYEVCRYVQHYHTVYDDWGFGRKIALGKGLNVLFSGLSGTGKTMAAEILANELKIDLYKIDLSAIISKYIGETEKNLDQIFREGQVSNAILFFDEADALFGKRSEVRDSHDRYANIEVAYLLQKMDEYDGIVILATNLRKNMDDAFARRMHYTVEFPVPEEPDRYRIWQNVFPNNTPLSPEIDLKFMSRQFKITGGNIKNIALSAAFLAADDRKPIIMEHLIKATRREYQKIGKLCTEMDFGKYFELVKS